MVPRPDSGHFTPPVNTIPIEIVKEIFQFVVSHDFDPEENFNIFDPYNLSLDELIRGPHLSTYASCASPFALSHVSQHWRTIALDSPTIWTYLRVISPTTKGVELIKLWLARGRSMLLSLSLFQGANVENAYAAEAVLSLFLEHIGRWRFIELSVHENVNYLLSDGSAATMSTPEALQTIKVIVGHQDHAQRANFYRLLHSSPNLRTAVWDNTLSRIQMGGMTWSSVVNLTLDVIYSYVDLRQALLNCKRLQRLVIHRVCDRYDAAVGVPLLELASLRYLKLSDATRTSSLFSNLTLPRLEELHLKGRDRLDGGFGVWLLVRPMLHRSACSLRVFSITDLYVPEDKERLISTLRLPNFETLTRFELHLRYTSSVTDFSTVTSESQENIKHIISTSRARVAKIVSNTKKNCGWKGKNFDLVCAAKIALVYEEEEAPAQQENWHHLDNRDAVFLYNEFNESFIVLCWTSISGSELFSASPSGPSQLADPSCKPLSFVKIIQRMSLNLIDTVAIVRLVMRSSPALWKDTLPSCQSKFSEIKNRIQVRRRSGNGQFYDYLKYLGAFAWLKFSEIVRFGLNTSIPVKIVSSEIAWNRVNSSRSRVTEQIANNPSPAIDSSFWAKR